MADDRQPIDWARVVIHGLFGLFLGGLVGFVALFRTGIFLYHSDWGFALVLVSALGVGLAGAYWGDAFWDRVVEWWDDHGHWFWWRR
jgi:hypothetical protein